MSPSNRRFAGQLNGVRLPAEPPPSGCPHMSRTALRGIRAEET